MPKIFESPDGGKTVYSRELGSTERNFEWEDPEEVRVKERLRQKKEWEDILNAAEHNPALQKAIERVKLIYYLGEKDGKKQIR